MIPNFNVNNFVIYAIIPFDFKDFSNVLHMKNFELFSNCFVMAYNF